MRTIHHMHWAVCLLAAFAGALQAGANPDEKQHMMGLLTSKGFCAALRSSDEAEGRAALRRFIDPDYLKEHELQEGDLPIEPIAVGPIHNIQGGSDPNLFACVVGTAEGKSQVLLLRLVFRADGVFVQPPEAPDPATKRFAPWIIRMESGLRTGGARVRNQRPAPSAVDDVDSIAATVATSIESLKGNYPHLESFSPEKHVTKTLEHAGFAPGSPNNPELVSISYSNGIIGQSPIPKSGNKRSTRDIFDPEKGVRLYVHFFVGDSRGNDMRPPERIGNLNVHLYVTGPAGESIRGEILKTIAGLERKYR